jgi:undecaprenyl-diphosphatase
VSEQSTVERFDALVDRWFDHLRGRPVADRVFYTASELGDWSFIWHLLGAGQGALLADGLDRAVRLSGCMGLESAIVNGGIKSLFKRTRPVHEAQRPHHLRVPMTSSFPSGHASAAFCAAALLSDGSRAKPVYYALALVVAGSRVHVRIHHASDVVGGIAVGVALGAIAKRWWPLGRAPLGLQGLLDRI